MRCECLGDSKSQGTTLAGTASASDNGEHIIGTKETGDTEGAHDALTVADVRATYAV